MSGGEARLSRRPFPIITGWGEVAPPVALVLRAHHVVFMHSGSRLWRQGAGRTRVDVVGRPQSPALPPLRLVERGGRGPTPPLYKERTGATEIRTPPSLRLPDSWLPLSDSFGKRKSWFFVGGGESCR